MPSFIKQKVASSSAFLSNEPFKCDSKKDMIQITNISKVYEVLFTTEFTFNLFLPNFLHSSFLSSVVVEYCMAVFVYSI
jgi:hypothetical protein